MGDMGGVMDGIISGISGINSIAGMDGTISEVMGSVGSLVWMG